MRVPKVLTGMMCLLLSSNAVGRAASDNGPHGKDGEPQPDCILTITAHDVNVDGSHVIDTQSNDGTIITTNREFTQEIQIQTSNFAAEYGNSGVQINVVTKSGGKDFHGSLYDQYRPWQTAANDRSRSTILVERPHDWDNFLGGTLGGPILLPGTRFNRDRDKYFFFVGLEFQNQLVASDTRLGVVPTLAQRRGDFREFLDGPFLLQSGPLLVPSGFPNAGRRIRDGNLRPYLDPTGRALAALYPLPTGLYANGLYNYASTALSNADRTDWKMRFDYMSRSRTDISVRWAQETETVDLPYGPPGAASSFALPDPRRGRSVGRSLAATITTIFDPTSVNELTLSGSRLRFDEFRDEASRTAPRIPGFTLPFGATGDKTSIEIASLGQGLGTFRLPGGPPALAYTDSYSIADKGHKVVGPHNLVFGGVAEQSNETRRMNATSPREVMLGSPWGTGSTGYDYGDLLVGRPARLASFTPSVTGHFRHYNYELFAQDSWRITPNLTLEYGLRASYLPNAFERGRLGLLFDPAAYVPGGPFLGGDLARPNGVLQEDRGDLSRGVNHDPGVKWAPRLGFAWDVFGNARTVVRGGAGVFYNRVRGRYQYDAVDQIPNVSAVSANAADYEGLTYGNFGQLVDPDSAPSGVAVLSRSPGAERIPRVVTMSFSIAQQVALESVFEVAYVGSQGRHLPYLVAANDLAPGTIAAPTPLRRAALTDAAVNAFRPWPAFDAVDVQEWSGTSSYHALQATLRRQTGSNVQYLVSYTFSKALGALADGESGAALGSTDVRGRSYGVLPFDRTHVFKASCVWSLPNGARGQLRNAFTRGLLDEWNLSGITMVEAGTPLRVRLLGDYASTATRLGYFGTPSGPTAIDYLTDPRIEGKSVGERLLDGRALGLPAFGQEGTYQAPYYLRGPSRFNTDVSLYKQFGFTESQSLEVRLGFFNIFNQAYAEPRLGDIRLDLQTRCVRRVNGVPNGSGGRADNVCDPTGGYRIVNADEFGTIVSKHGHRVIEFALAYRF
jgi:hypothetical protein